MLRINKENKNIFICNNQLALNKVLNKLNDLKVNEYYLFNFKDIKHSNRLSILSFLKDDKDVFEFCALLVKNLQIDNEISISLLQSLILFLLRYRPVEERNFVSVLKLLSVATTQSTNPLEATPLDLLFKETIKRDPSSIANKQYTCFKSAPLSIQKQITATLSSKLSLFNIFNIKFFTSINNFAINNLLFDESPILICLPDTSDALYFYAKMFPDILVKNMLSTNQNINIFIDKNIEKTSDFYISLNELNTYSNVTFKKVNFAKISTKTNENLLFSITNEPMLDVNYNIDSFSCDFSKKISLEENIFNIRKLKEDVEEILKENNTEEVSSKRPRKFRLKRRFD